jgi:hypothetical protein
MKIQYLLLALIIGVVLLGACSAPVPSTTPASTTTAVSTTSTVPQVASVIPTPTTTAPPETITITPTPALVSTPTPLPTTQPSKLYYFFGNVRDSKTKAGINNAKVSISSTPSTSSNFNNTTDNVGYFLTSPMNTSGPFYIYVTAGGYYSQWYDGVTDSNKASPLTITAVDGKQNIDFYLKSSVSISGKVTNADGSIPLAGVYVGYHPVAETSVNTTWYYVKADSQGGYAINNLSSGEYLLRAWGQDINYCAEYYPNQKTKEKAQILKVNTGAPLENVDFTLEPGGSISGKVVSDVGGKPISNVYMYANNLFTDEWIGYTYTRADGSYTILGLPKDNYRVSADPSYTKLPYAWECYDNTIYFNYVKLVYVQVGKDTPGINFSLAPK